MERDSKYETKSSEKLEREQNTTKRKTRDNHRTSYAEL